MINHFHQMSYCIQDTLCTPLPKQQNVDKLFPTNQDTSINLDIEENSAISRGCYI